MLFTWHFDGKCLNYSSVLAIFDGNIWLSIFFIVLLGTLFGMIPFGPLRFGAAGTLFVGLAFGSFIDLDKDILSSLQELGLGLFIYMQGLSAGERFFKGFSKQMKHMLTATIAIVVAAGAAILFGGMLGLVALESFASGVPVVGTNAGGIPFVIEHGKTGLLVDEEATNEQWASALCSLLEDPQARQRMGRAAREEAERYSWRESTKALVAAYEYACRHPYHREQP